MRAKIELRSALGPRPGIFSPGYSFKPILGHGDIAILGCRRPRTTAGARAVPFCINCDNRHGCKNGLPECLRHNREPGEEKLRGREFMKRRGMLDKCAK